MRLHCGPCSAAYICSTRHQRYGEPICQRLTIGPVDRAVAAAFVRVIGPAQVEAALALVEELDRHRAVVERQWGVAAGTGRVRGRGAFRQYDLCEPENRLVARELEGRWNHRLRLLADLEAEYRREQDRGLAPRTADERAALGQLVGNVPALWAVPEMTMEDRKRLVRCLVQEVVLLRDGRARATGASALSRMGWRSGAWTELRVRWPSSGETARTPAPVLAGIGLLAHQHPDDRVAAILNAEGVRTRQGLPWTYGRVGNLRYHHGIPTACPSSPRDGLVSVGAVAARLGVARSAAGRWCRCGFIAAQQKAARDPRAVRLAAEDLARLDGTLAAQGYGRWRIPEAQRTLGLSQRLYQRVRDGKLIAYRARVGEQREWRVSLTDHQPPQALPRPAGVHAQGKDVHARGLTECELAVLATRCLDRRLPDPATVRREVAAWPAVRRDTVTLLGWLYVVGSLLRLLPLSGAGCEGPLLWARSWTVRPGWLP